jgi:NADH-quinone oxidoreductase subunit G
MIDVCPVGALTDKTFRFKSEFGSTSLQLHTESVTNVLVKQPWMFGDEIQRVTGRKDVYHEVEEFICNGCRFDHKDPTDWVIEGPRAFDKDSVINQNNYTQKLETVVIDTEDFILKVENKTKK